MKKLETISIKNWGVAKKTKNIRAKPMISLMVDKTVTNKFLIDTLEGKEPLGDGSICCIGESNDVWQQMPKKLIGKYNVIGIDNDGWMICEPRPDNSVNVIEVTKEFFNLGRFQESPLSYTDNDTKFYIVGQWGSNTPEVNSQIGEVGDFICQNREDPTDVWVVKRKIFINTYTILNEEQH